MLREAKKMWKELRASLEDARTRVAELETQNLDAKLKIESLKALPVVSDDVECANCSIFLADLALFKEKHASKCEELDVLRVEVVELKSRSALLGACTSCPVLHGKIDEMHAHAAFVATFEPKDIGHALSDHNWVNSMHEDLENFERNHVWELVDPPPGCKPIGTKWVWKNKEGEKGEVVRNKSRLVAQGFSQKEGIDYEETFATVVRLEAIRILLAFSMAKGFKWHKMDVKSAFLNGVLEEEVYVRQPPVFESEKYPHRVYKLRKALYGLKQASRAWYGRLRGFLFERGFEMGKVDQTLFLLRQGKDILIVQVYVDDIVFGGASNSLVAKFAEDMSREFEMSIMGEL
jgi:hypothetical protein